MEDKFINPRRFYAILMAIVLCIPCMVLAGWHFNIDLLKRVLPPFISMNPFTAALFIFSGISLSLLRENKSIKVKIVGQSIAILITLISVLTLGGIFNVLDIGLHHLLYANDLNDTRMAPNTAICFLMVGVSLLLIDKKSTSRFNFSQIVVLITLIIGLITVIGYIYGSRSFSGLPFFISMAFHTAFSFCALAIAIMLSRYKTGFVSVVMHKNIGGVIIRRLLPFSIALPIIINWLRLEGDKLNLYDPEFGSALGVICIISTFAILMWWISSSLNKTDEERKKSVIKLYTAKDELAANEVLYRNLIENSRVVIYTTSLEGIITFASNKSFELTGYKMEELKGKSFIDFVTEDCMQRVKESYKIQLKDNIEETILEFCIHTKNEGIKWVKQSAVLITENHVPVGFQCIVKDISESKEMESIVRRYENELIQNQELLQSILDNANSSIYIKSLEGRYLLANKYFLKKLNLNLDEVIGRTDFDISGKVQAQRFKDTDDEVLTTCKPVELEDIIELTDGLHTFLITKFPLIDAQNKIYGISGIATDITERVRYQEELIEARKIAEAAKTLQEQFLANMSHEIRTPMNGIQGMNDLLLETELNNEQKDFATTIKRSADNLLVILDDILDFSKIQAGKLNIEKIDFNLHEVLNNMQALFRHQVKEKGLTLQLIVNENVPATLNGDPHRLNQVLVNLLGNAIKFTHQGGITISILVQQQTATEIILSFIVTDTGIGIKNDVINNIFESFTQASNNTTRKYGGTGLGLAITKQLLEMQQGNISVESKIDIGTTFQFSIPYQYSKTNGSLLPAGINVKNYHSLFKGKKFLVAEDNEVNQKVIRRVLQRAGGTVDVVNNGLEAIAHLKMNKDYHLVIMDLQMPEMDGYAATRYIRNVMNLSLPIVAMTASALKHEEENCIDFGMNDYVSKPFNFLHLYQRLNLLLFDNPVCFAEKVLVKKTNTELFDLSLLKEMDDNEYLLEIVGIFLTSTPGELKILQQACTSYDFDTIYKLAHKLKSSAGLLQAEHFLSLLIRIEEAAKAEKVNKISGLCKELYEQYKKIEIALQILFTNIKNQA